MNPLIAAMLMSFAPAAPASDPDPGCTTAQAALVPLFLGVASQTVTVTCPSGAGKSRTKVQVVRVDLTAPGLSFEASGGAKDNLKLELPTAFLERTGSQVAFNANLFVNCCSYTPPSPPKPATTDLCGLQISGGKILSEWTHKPKACHGYPFRWSLVVRNGKLSTVQAPAVLPGAETAVTGSHELLFFGRNMAPPDKQDEFFGPNARTVVGLSRADNMLWVAAVTRETSQGLTLRQAAQMLQQLGAAHGINFDGGGSTSLAVDGGGGKAKLLNTPSDPSSSCTFPVRGGCERFVGASFGIHARPLPARR
ncbi:MAG TPA: phosphodiester glycosidase family protein [Allosphingosinicella sp.]|jgi:hypothetical protein